MLYVSMFQMYITVYYNTKVKLCCMHKMSVKYSELKFIKNIPLKFQGLNL